MKSLGSTIDDLKRHNRYIQVLASAALTPAKPVKRVESARLSELVDFGSNPGNLRAWLHVPEDLSPGAALVVVLHGCNQSVDDYDSGAQWSARAAELGAAILYPEQKTSNNSMMCFNWFVPQDVSREGGEAASIRQMIVSAAAAHNLSLNRVYVTGLSAGGAMAAALLGLYPELFAAGAILAGLPFGCASNALEALEAMTAGASHSAELATLPWNKDRSRWPRVSIWQGLSDDVVRAANSERLVEQWLAVHNLAKDRGESADSNESRTVWRDDRGRPVIEQMLIPQLGHGTPIGARESGALPSRYMLDVGLDSTLLISRGWGLAPSPAPRAIPSTVWGPASLRTQALRCVQSLGFGRKASGL